MGKTYRIYYKGAKEPTDWHTQLYIVDAVQRAEAVGREVLFVEDIDFKPLIDKEIEIMKDGTSVPLVSDGMLLSYIEGVYYIEEPHDREPMETDELDARRRLQVDHNYMLKESGKDTSSYIEEGLRDLLSMV